MNREVEDRILALEELTAHQARTIEELSQVLTRNGERQAMLEKTLEAVAIRLGALEGERSGEDVSTKPPHW